MYDAVLAGPPFFIRWLVKNQVDAALTKRGCGTVTEDIMYDVCREVTPKMQLDKTMEILDKHRTTTTTTG
jgi:hypothetical protein